MSFGRLDAITDRAGRWAVAVEGDEVLLVIEDLHGKRYQHRMSADCADRIAGGLHKSAKYLQSRAVLHKGAILGSI